MRRGARPGTVRARFARALATSALVAGFGGLVVSTLFAVHARGVRVAPERGADAIWSVAAAVLLFGGAMSARWLIGVVALRRRLGADRWRARRIVDSVLGSRPSVVLTEDELGAAASFARGARWSLLARTVGLGSLALGVLLLALGELVSAADAPPGIAIQSVVDEALLLLLSADGIIRLGRLRDWAATHPVPESSGDAA